MGTFLYYLDAVRFCRRLEIPVQAIVRLNWRQWAIDTEWCAP